MSSVARISADVVLNDLMTAPLKGAGEAVDKFADNAKASLNKANAAWKDFGTKLGDVSSKMQTTGLALTASITAPIALMAKKSIDAASNLNESLTKTQQVFGASSKKILDFSNTSATAMGLAKQAALDYASSFGLILQAGGKTEDQSADMSKVLGQLSADLASFYNVDVADAATKIKSGLVGEAEPLRAFGVLLSETAVKSKALAMGFKEAGGQLSEQAKVQARYQIILEQTRKAQGDFVRTSDGFANQTRIIKAQFADISVELGQILLPYVQKAATMIQGLIEKFKALSPETKKSIVAFLGVAAAVGPLLLAFGSVAGAISNLIGAKGLLSGALNALKLAFTSSGGAVGVMGIALRALTGPIGIAITLATAMYVAYQKNMGGVRDSINALWANIKDFVNETVGYIMGWVNENREVLTQYWTFLKKQFAETMKIVVSVLTIAWEIIKRVIGSAIRVILGTVSAAMKIFRGDWKGAWEIIKQTAINVWLGLGAGIARIMAEILRSIQSFIQMIANAWDNLNAIMGNKTDNKISFLDGTITALDDYAKGLDAAQKATDRFKSGGVDIFGDITPSGTKTRKGELAPMIPMINAGGGGGEGKKEAKKENQDVNELTRLINQLAAAKLKDAGASLKDVLATEEYGKTYDKIIDKTRQQLIATKANIQAFEEEVNIKKQFKDATGSIRTELAKMIATTDQERALIELKASDLYQKLIPAQQKELETLTIEKVQREANRSAMESERQTRKALAESIATTVLEMRKQIVLISATTEVEKMRWEITMGAFKEANVWQKIYLLGSAQALDIEKRRKENAEKWTGFWKQLTKAQEEFTEKSRLASQDKYDDYIKKFTERMLELKGAFDEITKNQLTEQFKGLFPEIKNASDRAAKIAEAVNEIMRRSTVVAEAEKRFNYIKELATKMEDIWMKAFDTMLNKGFKGFLDGVIQGVREMAREIAMQLVRLQIQKALIWGVGQMFGAGVGKEFSSVIKGKAVGGMVTGGTPYLVGERGPELFVPPAGGRIIPNHSIGGGEATYITLNVITPDRLSFRKSDAQYGAEAVARAERMRKRGGKG